MSIVLLAGIALLDFLTGYEVHFFIFYYIPVGLLAWRASLRSALVMAAACAIVWFVVDAWLNRHNDVLFEVWNSSIRLAAFLILAVTLSRLRQAKDRLEHQHNQLRETLARVEATTAEAERLRKRLHTVCAWTKRIKDEGKWVSFEQFLSKHYGFQFTHGISDEGMRDIEKQLEMNREPVSGSSV